MSVPQMNAANAFHPPVSVVGKAAFKMVPDISSEPDAVNDFRIVSVDELKAVEGACRGELVKSSDDLVQGDEFRFPEGIDSHSASCSIYLVGTSIEVFRQSKFGPSFFCAKVTHNVSFMSETGKTLRGFVLNGSRNVADRPSVILKGEINPTLNYTLTEITEEHTKTECNAMIKSLYTGTICKIFNNLEEY